MVRYTSAYSSADNDHQASQGKGSQSTDGCPKRAARERYQHRLPRLEIGNLHSWLCLAIILVIEQFIEEVTDALFDVVSNGSDLLE